MPNIKSAIKRVKVNEKKRVHNVALKSSLKTAIKRFEKSADENSENAQVTLVSAIKSLDKAAAKGIIHKNAAARKKSRLTKRLASN